MNLTLFAFDNEDMKVHVFGAWTLPLRLFLKFKINELVS